MAFPIIPKKRSGSAGNPSSLSLGELAVNTFSGKLYLGADAGVAEIGIPVSAGTTATERTGDGTTVAFTFSGYNGTDDGGYIVSVGGIDQPPSTYAISATAGGTITFSSAPTAGELISIRAIVSGPAVGGDATSLRGINISPATPTAGEALVYNGSSWQADTPSADATKIQGRNISSTAPTDKQSLVWNAGASVWEPATGTGADIGGRAWSNTATYSEGDLVATSQSETWICIQNSNTGNDPATSPTWWDKMPANAVTLQGSAVSATAPTTTGQVLGWNGTAWAPAGAGTVTSVTAGTGLQINGVSGASITEAGTLDIIFGPDAGQICAGNDSRLNNTREPIPHKNTHAQSGSDFLSPDDIGAVPKSRQILTGTGLSGGGALSADKTLSVTYGTTAGTSAQGNDARLSNARTPTAHKLTHAIGGTDALSPADIGAAASGINTDLTSVALTTGTVSTAPSGANDIATKAYADSIGSGINFHDAADYATTASLSAAYTYSNGTNGIGARITANAVGTLTIDGYTLLSSDVGKRLLIKNETGAFSNNTTPSAAFNGVYTLTTAGTASVAYVLTRATDYDTSGTGINEINQGDFILVLSGSSNANSAWVQQTRVPITVGTSSLAFTQFAAAAAGVSSFVTTLSGLTPSGTPGTGVVSLGGTLGVSSGGTGATTQQAALNALAGATTSAQFLRGNGTNVSMSAIQASDVPTLNQNTTGTAANITGTVAVANGGTGATTLTGLIKGTGTTAMVAATAGTDYVVPSGNITGTAANVTGTVAVANGGSGQTSFTNGQLLIGNTTGNTLSKSTLTAGSGIVITNGAGAITIATTGAYLVDALIVAGGGGGGTWTGGGGGAGGLQSKTAVSLTPGTNYPIVVGSGGAGSALRANAGASGNASTALGFTSLGGGGGGSLPPAGPLAGVSGGSGGGGAGSPTAGGAGGAGTSGQGFAGATGASASPYSGGGGGGSSAVGGVQSGTVGGVGGAGTSSTITGSAVTYAGGGGGCPTSGGAYTGGAGGSGGGGAGGGAGAVGTAGTVNTGGGGGGGSNASSAEAAGGAGGSGVVILSVPTANYTGTVTGSPTVTTSGSNTIIKFTASGSYTA
jgi:hypothetical protein